VEPAVVLILVLAVVVGLMVVETVLVVVTDAVVAGSMPLVVSESTEALWPSDVMPDVDVAKLPVPLSPMDAELARTVVETLALSVELCAIVLAGEGGT